MTRAPQYDHRFYRAWHRNHTLERFELKIEQSDLLLLCDTLSPALQQEAQNALRLARTSIKKKIHQSPGFEKSLTPIDAEEDDNVIISEMCSAGQIWSVGPMAAVAGTVAECVAKAVLNHCESVIVENGGDIFARTPNKVRFTLYAGEDSPFKNHLTFETNASDGIGICTSSGKIGPSMSFGHADAVVAIHPKGSVADAAATAIANQIQTPADIDPLTHRIAAEGGLVGLIVCMGDQLGIFGELTLLK